MSILSGSQKTTINGGNFVDQTINGNISITNGQTGIDILLEASNRDAAHDSAARDYDPRCYPGTREQYTEDIVYWAVPSAGADDPLPLFWMKGLAGVGKSAIAQTCAEKLNNLGKLGASFFLSQNGREKAAEFIPTIVYQLSIKFPNYQDLVDQKIRRHKAIFDKTMATQFEALIAEPLQELERAGKGIGKRITIIVDELDECDSTDARSRIIKLIVAAARDGTTPFCWAFFSRPESHINATFVLADVSRVTCTTLLSVSNDANSDIEIYLRDDLENVFRRRNILAKSGWPSDEDIQTLVKASNGLFIYAAVVLRDVDQAKSPERALRTACATTANRTSNSRLTELDALYMAIMRRIPPDMLPTVLLLCNLLCGGALYSGGRQSSIIVWSNILTSSETEFRVVCSHLSAVLYTHDHSDTIDLTQSGDTNRPFQHANPAVVEGLSIHVRYELGGSIYFYHKSFYDFLIDATRSGAFCIHLSSTHNAYFKHCLEVVFKYEESYSFRGSELDLAPGLPDSGRSLSWPHTNEPINSMLKALVYSWAYGICFNFDYFPKIERQLLRRLSRADFRKALRNQARPYAGCRDLTITIHWNCWGYVKIIDGVQLFYVPRDQFQQRFDIVGFKAVIKRGKECGIIEPYYPDLTSRFKSLALKSSQDKPISKLYRLGHDPKSIFWHIEINSKEGYYQDFLAADLAEGERVYREQQFDLWPTVWGYL